MKYNGKNIKIIKDYGIWVLVQYEAGYKEGIHKQDLGLIRERIKPPISDINSEKVKIF